MSHYCYFSLFISLLQVINRLALLGTSSLQFRKNSHVELKGQAPSSIHSPVSGQWCITQRTLDRYT